MTRGCWQKKIEMSIPSRRGICDGAWRLANLIPRGHLHVSLFCLVAVHILELEMELELGLVPIDTCTKQELLIQASDKSSTQHLCHSCTQKPKKVTGGSLQYLGSNFSDLEVLAGSSWQSTGMTDSQLSNTPCSERSNTAATG